jgi:hypothetical protein
MYDKVLSTRITEQMDDFIKRIQANKGLPNRTIAVHHALLLAMQVYDETDSNLESNWSRLELAELRKTDNLPMPIIEKSKHEPNYPKIEPLYELNPLMLPELKPLPKLKLKPKPKPKTKNKEHKILVIASPKPKPKIKMKYPKMPIVPLPEPEPEEITIEI